MIIIGTPISETDIKVNSMFDDSTNVINVLGASVPEPPTKQDGKENELHLNILTNQLHWVQVSRPLTDAEKLKGMEAQNAQMLLALVIGGLM